MTTAALVVVVALAGATFAVLRLRPDVLPAPTGQAAGEAGEVVADDAAPAVPRAARRPTPARHHR